MKPNLRTFAVLGAIGCLLGGLLGELLLRPSGSAPAASGRNAIVLVIDASGSMNDDGKLPEVKRAASSFVRRQNLNQTLIAVVGFGSRARLEASLTSNRAELLSAIERIQDGGGTRMDIGLAEGYSALQSADARGRSILLFTDGQPDNARAALRVGQQIRNQGIGLVAVGTGDANVNFLIELAGSATRVFPASSGQFEAAFEQAERAIRQLFGGGGNVSGAQALWESLLRGGLMALGLAFLLMLGQNILTLRGRWFRDLGWVSLSAAGLGAVSAFVGQTLLLAAGTGRGLGWTILGAGAGLFLGLADRSSAKTLRGALGGAAGGLIGGLIFEMLLSLGLGVAARLVGFAVLGAFVGLMVQWAQQAFRQAWLVGTTTGPYEGKEYILAKPAVTVGRSDANDIGLYREKDLPLKAGALKLEQGQWRWEGEATQVNGQTATSAALSSGDRIRFGATEFLFRVRGGAPSEAKEAWMLQGNRQNYPLPFPLRSVTVGSDVRSGVMIAGLASQHAEVRMGAEGLELKALAEGVQVNGQAVPPGQSVALKPGALIQLGEEELALTRRR